jgi:hypothetical protein
MKFRGPIKGRIPAFGGAIEPEYGGFEAAKNIVAYRMAEILADQKGRAISDTDREVFFSALPKRTDTDEVASDKIFTTLNLLKSKMKGAGATEEEVETIIRPSRERLERMFGAEVEAEPPLFREGVRGIEREEVEEREKKRPGVPFLPFMTGVAAGGLATTLPVIGQIPGARGAIAGAGVATGERAQKVITGEAPPEAYEFGLKGRGLTKREVTEIGTGAALDFVLTGVTRLISRGGPKGLIGSARDKAAREATKKAGGISGDALVKAGEQAMEASSGTKRRTIEKFLASDRAKWAGKRIPVDKSVELFKGTKPYTREGTLAKGAANFYDKYVRESIKREWARVAPKVLQQTQKFGRYYRVMEPVKRIGKWLTIPALAKAFGLWPRFGKGD